MTEEKIMIGLEIHTYLNTESKLFCSCGTSPIQMPWVKEYLEKKNVEFEFVEHEAVTRPIDSAQARNVKIEQIAKALVYMADEKPLLLILSGNRKADNEKVKLIGFEKVRMASPQEVKEHTGCVVGLVPPTIDGIKKILDTRLMKEDLWSFNAGIATGGIKIKQNELLKLLDNYEVREISSDELIVEEPGAKKAHLPTIEAEPNSLCCPLCLGHPGSKPVLNKKAVELATKIGLSLNCEINKSFFFSRKTYFYPDMASNYQITQYEIPVAQNGFIEMNSGKKIRIRRAHLEADPAALIHPQGMQNSQYVLIDYNRSGMPLIEIVTEPDLDSAKEAREFLNELENILSYLKVLKPDTTLKIDCNISINGGNRVEIKNVSGFAAAEKALNFELLRQKRELRMNKKIEQHTRIFNADTGTTIEARKKETEADYGYIFDPDLVQVSLEEKYLLEIKKVMPELPQQKAQRFVKQFSIPEYDAKVICSKFELGKLFEELTSNYVDPQISSRILTRELLSILNHDSLSFNDVKIDSKKLIDLVELIKQGKVSDKNVKQSMINYISGDKTSPREFLEKNNMLISEEIDLDGIISDLLEKNSSAIDEYKKGNEKVLNFLAGLVMRETKGAVNPKEVQEKLKEKLSS